MVIVVGWFRISTNNALLVATHRSTISKSVSCPSRPWSSWRKCCKSWIGACSACHWRIRWSSGQSFIWASVRAIGSYNYLGFRCYWASEPSSPSRKFNNGCHRAPSRSCRTSWRRAPRSARRCSRVRQSTLRRWSNSPTHSSCCPTLRIWQWAKSKSCSRRSLVRSYGALSISMNRPSTLVSNTHRVIVTDSQYCR